MPVTGRQGEVQPPLVKAWEFDAGEFTNGHNCDTALPLSEKRFAFGTSNAYGVVDTRIGKLAWLKKFAEPSHGVTLAYDGGTLYAIIGNSRLVACDPASGAIRWSLPVHGSAAAPIIYQKKLFVSLWSGEISAVDLRSHLVLWTRKIFASTVPVTPRDLRSTLEVASAADKNVVLVGQGRGAAAFDTATGVPLWRHISPMAADDADVVEISRLSNDGLHAYCLWSDGTIDACDLQTGRTSWRSRAADFDCTTRYTSSLCIGRKFIAVASDGIVRGFDVDSGRSAWARQLAKPERNELEAPLSAPLLTHGTGALIADVKNIHAIDLATGRIEWSYNLDQDEASPFVCYTLGYRLVIASETGLRCFQLGRTAALPTEHRERLLQARGLAAQYYALLSGKERNSSYAADARRALLKYSSEAFEALTPYLKISALAANRRADSMKPPDVDLYSRFADVERAVSESMHAENAGETRALLSLVHYVAPNKKDDSVRSTLVDLIAQKGNEAVALPLLLEESRKITANDSGSGSYSALYRLCKSRDPRAVRLLITKLADPNAASTERSISYTSLANIGDTAGVAAVQAVRNRPEGRLPTFHDLMNLDRLTPTVLPRSDEYQYVPIKRGSAHATLLAFHRDAKGTMWGLMTSPALGSVGDLWIAPRTADERHWGEPIFTGQDTAKNHGFLHPLHPQPFTYDGLTLAQLIDDGVWVQKLVGNPDLRRDLDDDGWTDLVEKRLGTDPKRADTDGDGIRDSESRNPCGSRAPSGEAEEILAVAFDARTRFLLEDTIVPLHVTFPTGTTPFRLPGYRGIIIGGSANDESHTNLSVLYGEGMGSVSFCLSSGSITNAERSRREKSNRASDLIVWNAARTEATVGIGICYDGLAGSVYEIRLRKIDGRWTVVGSRMTIES